MSDPTYDTTDVDRYLAATHAAEIARLRAELAEARRTAELRDGFLLSCPWCGERMDKEKGAAAHIRHLIDCGDRRNGEWLEKLAEARREIAAAREACPAARMQRFFDASLLTLVNEEVGQLFKMQSRAESAEREVAALKAQGACETCVHRILPICGGVEVEKCSYHSCRCDTMGNRCGRWTPQAPSLECDQCGTKASDWGPPCRPLRRGDSCPRHYLDDDSCDGIMQPVAPTPEGTMGSVDKCLHCRKVLRLVLLDTVDGDPEGIRRDRRCPECGGVMGCTKSRLTKLAPPPGGGREGGVSHEGEAITTMASDDVCGSPQVPVFSTGWAEARRSESANS